MELFLNVFMDFGLWLFKGDSFTIYVVQGFIFLLLIFIACYTFLLFKANDENYVAFSLLLVFWLVFFSLSGVASKITIEDLKGYCVDKKISREILEKYVGKLKAIEEREEQKKKKKQEQKATAKKKEEARNRAIKELEV